MQLKYIINRQTKKEYGRIEHTKIVSTNMPVVAYLLDKKELIHLEFATVSETEARRIVANVFGWSNSSDKYVPTNLHIEDEFGIQTNLTKKTGSRYKAFMAGNTYCVSTEYMNSEHYHFIVGGTKEIVSPYFSNALKLLPVPFLSMWASELWPRAISSKLIVPLSGFNATGWKVNQDPEKWKILIVEMRQKEKLQTTLEKEAKNGPNSRTRETAVLPNAV